MHNLSTIFKDANIRNSLTQFTENHLDRVETSHFDKSGKPALKCLATHKDKIAIDASEAATLNYLEEILQDA